MNNDIEIITKVHRLGAQSSSCRPAGLIHGLAPVFATDHAVDSAPMSRRPTSRTDHRWCPNCAAFSDHPSEDSQLNRVVVVSPIPRSTCAPASTMRR